MRAGDGDTRPLADGTLYTPVERCAAAQGVLEIEERFAICDEAGGFRVRNRGCVGTLLWIRRRRGRLRWCGRWCGCLCWCSCLCWCGRNRWGGSWSGCWAE